MNLGEIHFSLDTFQGMPLNNVICFLDVHQDDIHRGQILIIIPSKEFLCHKYVVMDDSAMNKSKLTYIYKVVDNFAKSSGQDF